MRRDIIVKISIEFTAPKNARRYTHKTRKTFTHDRNIKNPFFSYRENVPQCRKLQKRPFKFAKRAKKVKGIGWCPWTK